MINRIKLCAFLNIFGGFMVTLSVIIITRNEEKNIEKSILSVIRAIFKASKIISSYEIILVDSNSSDRTVEIASGFAITIFQIDEQYKGPSAGRYIGYKNAKGDYILFLDGDQSIYEDFLLRAIRHMMKKYNLAGVQGYFSYDLPKKQGYFSYDTRARDFKRNIAGTESIQYESVNWFKNGTVIYKKSVLDKVGPFNPWIKGEEERELSFRITQDNFDIQILNIPMAHVLEMKESLTHKLQFFPGVGQCMKLHWNSLLGRELLKQYWIHFICLFFELFCIPTIFLSIFGFLQPYFWKLPTVILISVYIIIILLKGITKTTKFLIATLLQSFYILIGLVKRNRDIDSFPLAKLLKKTYSRAHA